MNTKHWTQGFSCIALVISFITAFILGSSGIGGNEICTYYAIPFVMVLLMSLAIISVKNSVVSGMFILFGIGVTVGGLSMIYRYKEIAPTPMYITGGATIALFIVFFIIVRIANKKNDELSAA